MIDNISSTEVQKRCRTKCYFSERFPCNRSVRHRFAPTLVQSKQFTAVSNYYMTSELCQDCPIVALSWGRSMKRTRRCAGAPSSSSNVMLLGRLVLSRGPGIYRVCWGPLAGQYLPRFTPFIHTWPWSETNSRVDSFILPWKHVFKPHKEVPLSIHWAWERCPMLGRWVVRSPCRTLVQLKRPSVGRWTSDCLNEAILEKWLHRCPKGRSSS